MICCVNRNGNFVQPAWYHSCQIKSDDSSSFRRSDTGAILSGDIITTNHSLVLAEMNRWQDGQWFLGKCGVLGLRILTISGHVISVSIQ